ncbi:MAG TPA: O-antigen ligase family protein [Longimicrobiales bacterium]|nr:O-antigen ligase family protein [Longimicrobiales bacterium]
MISRTAAPRCAWDSWVALAAVGACGCGITLGLAGAAAQQLAVGVVGAVLLMTGLFVLLAARWLDPLAMLVLSLPLPALFASASGRLAPVVLVSVLVVFARFAGTAVEGRPLALERLPLLPIGALLLALLLATGFSANRSDGMRELFNWSILLAFLAIAVTELVPAPGQTRALARLIAGVAAVCGALGVLEAVGILPARFTTTTTSVNRAALGFGWPNELGMFMAISLPFCVYACNAATSRGARVLACLGLVSAILGLAATFSRGSWLAAIGGSLFLLFTGERRFVLRVWLAAFAAVVVLDVVSGGALRARLASTIGDWVLEQRVALTYAGVLMFRAHPVFGVGPGGFADALEEFGPAVSWLWDYLPTAQNAYVQMAAEAGLIGLVALIALLAGIMHRLRSTLKREAKPAERALPRALVWSFGIVCLLGFGEWLFAHGIGELIMLVAAMGFVLPAQERA